MKKRVQFLASILLISLVSVSCIPMGPSIKGNGNVVTEERNLDSFDKVIASRGVNVYLSQGETQKVVIKADENLIDVIQTEVNDSTLKIFSSANVRKAKSFKVFVTVPNYSEIKTNSGSNVYSETIIKSEELVLTCSSGSNMKMKTDAGKLTAKVSSGANIKLRGSAKTFRGRASSGANLMAEKLVAGDCIVKAGSGANLWITVKNSFDADAGSGANIFYFGDPKSSDIEKSSGGNVIKK